MRPAEGPDDNGFRHPAPDPRSGSTTPGRHRHAAHIPAVGAAPESSTVRRFRRRPQQNPARCSAVNVVFGVPGIPLFQDGGTPMNAPLLDRVAPGGGVVGTAVIPDHVVMLAPL